MKTTRTLIALAACIGLMNQAFAKATNDELKIGIAQEFDSLNPMLSSMVDRKSVV